MIGKSIIISIRNTYEVKYAYLDSTFQIYHRNFFLGLSQCAGLEVNMILMLSLKQKLTQSIIFYDD